MEKIPANFVEQPDCAAARLAKYVDDELNGAARREFADATSETQNFGADLNEGSAYLDDRTVSFTEQSVTCDLCQGVAKISPEGFVESTQCQKSGFCEIEWAESYPERYKNDDGNPSVSRLTCTAKDVGCKAVINLVVVNGKLESSLSRGVCEVAKRGDDWQARRDIALQGVECYDPTIGIERFDGEGSGREEGTFAL